MAKKRPVTQKHESTEGKIAHAFEAQGAIAQEPLDEFFAYSIIRAVFRENSISFDWQVGEDEIETVHLTSSDGHRFTGRSTNCPGTNAEYRARVDAALYSNPKGHVLLADCIYEDGREESWVVRFSKGKELHY